MKLTALIYSEVAQESLNLATPLPGSINKLVLTVILFGLTL